MLLSELADITCASFLGKDVEISNIDTLENAKAGDITFLFNRKYAHLLSKTAASAVILPEEAPDIPLPSLRSRNPHLTYAKVMNVFKKSPVSAIGISEKAFISQGAEIGNEVSIYPGVYIGRGVKIGNAVSILPGTTVNDSVTIGDGTIIYDNVSIRERVSIGNNVIVQSGVVIGSDGFGFAKQDDGSYIKIPHTGNVVIEDDVEIGANCTIDRASFGSTFIRKGAKIDNLVHVAHSVEVGENVLLVAQVGIAGSARIGKDSILAGKASVAGHVKIGKGSKIGPLAAVSGNLSDGSTVGGAPAFDASLWKKSVIAFKKLPELLKDVRSIKKHLKLQ